MIASSDDSTIAARCSGDQGGSARTASRASTCIRAQGSKTGASGDEAARRPSGVDKGADLIQR